MQWRAIISYMLSRMYVLCQGTWSSNQLELKGIIPPVNIWFWPRFGTMTLSPYKRLLLSNMFCTALMGDNFFWLIISLFQKYLLYNYVSNLRRTSLIVLHEANFFRRCADSRLNREDIVLISHKKHCKTQTNHYSKSKVNLALLHFGLIMQHI